MAKSVKVSVCVTVLNEEDNMSSLMDSLLSQTKKADEIVIVDGGSSDKTRGVISKFIQKNKRIKFFVKRGNIASGRNFAITKAKSSIIALTDAGCVASRDWLQKLTKPFEKKDIELVAGFYDMPSHSSFQEALSVFLGVSSKRFNQKTFLPSGRSVALRKNVWKDIGGFDESLSSAGEDTLFFYNAVKKGVKITRVKEARVEWKELEQMTAARAVKKFFNYAKGDGEAGIWWHPSKGFSSHNIKILTIYFRYMFFLLFFLLSFINPLNIFVFVIILSAYSLWSIAKWRDVIKDTKTRVWLPIIQLFSDFAVMSGFFVGTIKIWVIKK